ncbi:MAG TPA: aminotransferase class I/II-fold pyridoxal phosphate-dependent enzyme [Pirellulales bacterium]|nr:aminotransferase class I/II-fold pyridoxal phosphate-dependent enzyme [Pirellulales bacterium]
MKTKLNELAIFGGRPEFAEPLHVGRPNIGDRRRLFERLSGALDRHWLSNDGPLVREFESRVASLLGVEHCVAVGNGTAALEILFRAADLSGEVVMPSFTFVATAHAARWLGLEPVFCDIDPETHRIDPPLVERLITPRTSAIVAVHLWGRPGEVAALEEIAARHNLKLVFDAAHAFGCSYRGRMVGGFGLAEIFSFHPTKFVNAFEGGAVTTNDRALADRLRLMRNFGFSGYDRVADLGINAKMNEAAAAMALTNLDSMDDFIAVNQRNYQAYCRELHALPGIRVLPYDEQEKCNFQYVVIEVGPDCGLPRDQLVALLWSENVLARRYFYPGCHRAVPYREPHGQSERQLPATEEVSRRVLLLPTGAAVQPAEIAAVAALMRLAVRHAAEVADEFKRRPPTLPAALPIE